MTFGTFFAQNRRLHKSDDGRPRDRGNRNGARDLRGNR